MMWCDSDIFEIFKGSISLYLILMVPIFIIISPTSAMHDFTVYRMQHYDLQGTQFGSRNAQINLEARVLESGSFARRVILVKLRDFTLDVFQDIINQGAGGIIVLVPQDLSQLNPEEIQELMEIERDILAEETTLPVYFAIESEQLNSMYTDVQRSANTDASGSAFEAMMVSLSSNGYQMVVSGSQTKALPESQITNIQGKLPGYGIEEQLPTVAIVAHYDTLGISPELSFGADSNGSGVCILLELVRLFSRLYSQPRLHAKFNLLFLLSSGGKFNYQGSKRWIEDQLDGLESSLLQDVAFTLCLDTLGAGDSLNVHVSKPPKENSLPAEFIKELGNVAEKMYPEVKVQMIHKKINLNSETLAWEHERYSLRRLPALTLSHLHSPNSAVRASILDRQINEAAVMRNAHMIAEALVKLVYNASYPSGTVFSHALSVDKSSVEAWMDYLSSVPRAASLLSSSKQNHLVGSLETAMNKYLKEVKTTALRPDKREPEFQFYDMSKAQIHAYSVKPPIFELVLSVSILAYLFVIYVLLKQFPLIYGILQSLVRPSQKTKVQ